MVYGNQQAEEIKTIKPRQFNLNLSDADYRRIAEKAACAELSVEGLLESFIGDLVSGTYSNGSDERMKAQEWYERCGYDSGFDEKYTLLHYLISEGSIDDFVREVEEFENNKDDIESTKKELEDPQEEWEQWTTGEDNHKAFNSLEEYKKSLEDEIKDYECFMNAAAETLDDYWQEYLQWTDTKEPDRKEEFKKVMDWYEKYILEGNR